MDEETKGDCDWIDESECIKRFSQVNDSDFFVFEDFKSKSFQHLNDLKFRFEFFHHNFFS